MFKMCLKVGCSLIYFSAQLKKKRRLGPIFKAVLLLNNDRWDDKISSI